MAHIIDLKTFTDDRGNLTVIEKVIPFDIKRIFYIYGVVILLGEGIGIIRLCKQQFVCRDIVRYQIIPE